MGGNIGILLMIDEAKMVGAMIALLASCKARSMPGKHKGSVGKGHDGSSNRSEGVHNALMWG